MHLCFPTYRKSQHVSDITGPTCKSCFKSHSSVKYATAASSREPLSCLGDSRRETLMDWEGRTPRVIHGQDARGQVLRIDAGATMPTAMLQDVGGRNANARKRKRHQSDDDDSSIDDLLQEVNKKVLEALSAIQEKLNDTRKKYKDMKVQFKETDDLLKTAQLRYERSQMQVNDADGILLECREMFAADNKRRVSDRQKYEHMEKLWEASEKKYQDLRQKIKDDKQQRKIKNEQNRERRRQKQIAAEKSLQDTQARLDEVDLKRIAAEREGERTAQRLKDADSARTTAEKKHEDARKRVTVLEAQLKSALAKRIAVEKQLSEVNKQLSTVEKQLSNAQMQQRHFGSHSLSWQYEMEGHWHAFPPEGNDQMHQAYMSYIGDSQCCSANIIAGGVERIVDFQAMTQTHASTKKVRQIRLSTGVPAEWSSSPATLLTQSDTLSSFYVEVTDASLIDAITCILRSSGHAGDESSTCSRMQTATVKSVHRIENFQLWHRYQARLAAMREDHAKYCVHVDPAALDLDCRQGVMTASQSDLDCGACLANDVDEKILLHGTSWSNANSIVMHGFDHRTCMRGMYGDGVYFAGAACKSHQYSCGAHPAKTSKTSAFACKCERTLIIARVALGDAYYASATRRGARRPPNRDGATGTHGSVVVNPGSIQGHRKPNQVHQEFVIYDREQAYPAFVVQYLP
eukprot:s1600_g13.t1